MILTESGSPSTALSFEEASDESPLVLGGKGYGLARMTALGIPVPPGFTVTCEAAREFRRLGELGTEVVASVDAHLAHLEETLGRRFDDPEHPLLVSVRSGAPISMPGMMDTVLNVGLTDTTVEALVTESGNPDFVWSCRRRFVDSYAHIVRGISRADIEDALFELDDDQDDRAVVSALLALCVERTGEAIPTNARDQILESIRAVFQSWDSPRAKSYREFRGIDETLCTAATVQAMVFGNLGDNSASGVAFTRDPSSGEPKPFGDILFDAQGEDVVGGENDVDSLDVLDERLPDTAAELRDVLVRIERDARDLSEVEFTVERGRLWVLQTRVGLRSGRAAVRTAVDLVSEGVTSEEEALGRLTAAKLHSAAASSLAAGADDEVIGAGLAASPGAAVGVAVFDPARAVELAESGVDVILIRPTTSPSDVAGFIAARGIVTGRGGRTSHAAVVARGMNRPAVCGVGDVQITNEDGVVFAVINGRRVTEGDSVSVDGDRGRVYAGVLPLTQSHVAADVERVRSWARDRANVPWKSAAETADFPVVKDLDEWSDVSCTVVIDLDDPRRVSAPALLGRLKSWEGAPPILRVTERWLREADVRLDGRVDAITGDDDARNLPGVDLLRCELSHAG